MDVYITGPAFAGLLRALEDSDGDVEGFMFGTCSERSIEQLSDSSVASKKRAVTVYAFAPHYVVDIHSFAYSHAHFTFYDEFGRVNCFEVEKLAEMYNKVPHLYQHCAEGATSLTIHIRLPLRTSLPDWLKCCYGGHADLSSIVGWFTYRRNSRHRLSLREKAVHRSFLQLLEHIPRDAFISALLTPEANSLSSVHSHNCTLFRAKLDVLEPVCMKIANLHSTSNVAYRKAPMNLTGHQHLEDIASGQKNLLLGESGKVLPIVSVYNRATESLEKMKTDLIQSSQELFELDLEVKILEDQLASMHEKVENQQLEQQEQQVKEEEEEEKDKDEEERVSEKGSAQAELEEEHISEETNTSSSPSNLPGQPLPECLSIVQEFDPI